MKILYLITKSEAGGAQTYVYQLARYFNKNNEVAVMSDGKGWLCYEASKIGIKFFKNNNFSNSINPISIIRAMMQIKKVVKEFKPDLIHCNSSMASFLGRLMIRNKVPTIFTAHGWGFNIGVPPVQKFLAIIGEKLVSQYCFKIICVSNFVKDLAVKYKIAKEKKLTVIYNGIEKQDHISRDSNKKVRIVFIGRLAEPKKPMLLLKTLNKFSSEIKNKFEVNIIGDGPKKQDLEKYIIDNKLDNVKLLGQLSRDEVFNVLKKSDVLVFLSKYEGFPYVILEAMSFGLPVISSNVGGVKEIVDSNCGVLLENDYDLKNALEKFEKSRELIKEKGINSLKKIRKDFSIEEMTKETERVYNEIIK